MGRASDMIKQFKEVSLLALLPAVCIIVSLLALLYAFLVSGCPLFALLRSGRPLLAFIQSGRPLLAFIRSVAR